MGIDLTTLFVPLGLAEFAQVVASNGASLPSQVDGGHLSATLNHPRAVALARRQAKAHGDGASFLVKVEVVTAYLQRLEPPLVGRGSEVELRIPSEALPGFSRRIARSIRLLQAFYGPAYAGRALPGQAMFGNDIELFLSVLGHAAMTKPAWPPSPALAIGPFYALERDWDSLLGKVIAPTRATLADQLLRHARCWLLSNLGFWQATGRLPDHALRDLRESLRVRFPNPRPTLRGMLVD